MNLELSWHDEHKVQRYPLPEARPVTIGWQDCDIILSDKTVSRRNMHLYVAEGSFHLKNLSQTNAIYVYTQQELEPGQTMLLSADSTLQLGTEQIRFKLTPTDNTDYWLTFVSDQRTYQFSKEKVVMGRHDTCDIALDNRTVSRQHAEIFFRAGQAHVRNLSPTNDVYVRLKYHLPQGGSTTLSGVSGFRVGLIHIQAVAPDAMGETEKALAAVYKVTCPGSPVRSALPCRIVPGVASFWRWVEQWFRKYHNQNENSMAGASGVGSGYKHFSFSLVQVMVCR